MKKVIASTQALWRMFAEIADAHGETFEKTQMVTCEDYKPPRSLSQNARLHCLIRALADFCGYSESECKDWLKYEFGRKRPVMIGDSERMVPVSTTEYSREEMAAFMDQVDRICAESGVYVEEVHADQV